MKYRHVNRNGKHLLVIFNDMTKTGIADYSFSPFNHYLRAFDGYDFLFFKDIEKYYWYLTVQADICEIIRTIQEEFNYLALYGIGASSGAMPLLNTLPNFPNFKHGVVLNGQVSLDSSIIDKYSSTKDIHIFNKNDIKESYPLELLTPLENLPSTCYSRITYYYNDSLSDKVYYDYVCSKYQDRSQIHLSTNGMTHGEYLISLYTDTSFLQKIKELFDTTLT